LSEENSDIILTDLVEHFVKSGTKRAVRYYENMIAGKKYKFVNVNFPSWGPMLPTKTVKTKLLRDSRIKIDEHCFYVDQEYNFIAVVMAKTVTYYALSIYYYRLEREGQSMTRDSVKRNVYHHEKVCMWLIVHYLRARKRLGKEKGTYLVERVIIPMCHLQYVIATEYYDDGKSFRSFDKKLKKFPEFYRNEKIAGRVVSLHRITHGVSVRFDKKIKEGMVALKKLRKVLK
jgi:hypothetical protein